METKEKDYEKLKSILSSYMDSKSLEIIDEYYN